MKYLLRFCSLLLCVCIFLGLFSVSAHAEDETQSFYDVVSSWYPENWNDEKFDFEGTIKADQNYPKIYIESTIMFSEPTELGVVNPIDLVVYLDIGGGSVAVEKTEMYGTEYNVISNPDCIYDSSTKTLTFKDLTSDVKASQIFVCLSVTNPVYDIKNIPNFTIDGVQYRGGVDITTWESWVDSSYNTGGFKIDSNNYNITTADGSKLVSMLRSDGMYAPVTKAEQLENTDYILQEVTVTPSIDLTECDYYSLATNYDTSKNFDVSLNNAYLDSYGYILSRVTLNNGTLTIYYKTSSNGSTTMKQIGSNGSLTNWSYYIWRFETNPSDIDFLNWMSKNAFGHSYESGGANDPWIDGPSASYSLRSIVQSAEYHFPFSVLDLEINVKSSEEIQGGIFAWVKKIFKSIVDLPKNIGNAIKGFFVELGDKFLALGDKILNGIKDLFVPSQDDILEMVDKFEALLADRFGAAYQAVDIVDDFANTFSYSETKGHITIPSVTINLVGTDFTFGGWEVDIIPDGFEGLQETLKLIINIICTIAFVNVLKKRFNEVFH